MGKANGVVVFAMTKHNRTRGRMLRHACEITTDSYYRVNGYAEFISTANESTIAQRNTLGCAVCIAKDNMRIRRKLLDIFNLTIPVLQACCAVTTEYGIASDFVRKSTASLKI